MKHKVHIYFLTLAAVMFATFSFAQDRVIHGIVTTFDSIPVVGADVTVKSTKQTVLTDTLGEFAVGIKSEDKLKISADGFFNQKVKLEENTKFAVVNIRLKPGDKNLEYAYAFTKATDRDKLNALASKSNDEINYSIYTNMFDAIQGRFPGVAVSGGQIIIRGNNTINGTSPALIVVDGVPINQAALNALNTSDVKRITVIKDGSSAIYGAKGANGVIEITTKSGSD